MRNDISGLDHCEGCEIERIKRVNLSIDFKDGDEMPKDLTIHDEPDRKGFQGRLYFAFIGKDTYQERHYFDYDTVRALRRA